MATIEPRLMHLLNEAKTPNLAPIKLPPLGHNGNGSSSNLESVSLPPIEQPADTPTPKIPPFKTLADEVARQSTLPEGQQAYGKEQGAGRAASLKSGLPIHTLLDKDPETNGSSHSLRMILDDNPDNTEDTTTKKRHRAPTVKEDFPQLPQPLKKQKSTQQVVPPIINGLQDPPPNALVFPPILMDEDDEDVSRVLKEFISPDDKDNKNANTSAANNPNLDKDKGKRRLTKPRRKWSEEETNHLLLGVSKHGVGKWTTILEDPEFKFNDRSAGDLKDRFRTCCPDELRKSASKGFGKDALDVDDGEISSPSPSKAKPVKGPHLEDLLAEPDMVSGKSNAKKPSSKDGDAPRQRRSRAHRKKIEDLEELGITGPFKKSDRRQRRPFSEQDDKEILEGLDVYGPQWTKIQRDPNYHLSSRQPTDLRDRVRNKYPEIYARIEKGNMQMKNPDMHKTSTLEPSVSTSIEVSFDPSKPGLREPQLNKASSGEELRGWSMNNIIRRDDQTGSNTNAGGNMASAIGNVDQMDISRLLLDDS
ncbi:hypothetical protein GQ53DRAFT_629965, partial [Thozetella sp. PMI_491]